MPYWWCGVIPESITPIVSITASAEATVPANLTLVGKGSEGDFTCEYYSDGSLRVDSYSGTSTVVNIPEYINGKKVRSLMVDFFYYYGVNITDIYVPATVALVSSSGTGYTYADAYSVMKSKYGLTLHMTGFDIPVEPEAEPITLPYYKILNDGTIAITGCDESATAVIIPSEIDGAKVTRIGREAFKAYKNLKSINIPDSVTEIDWYTFENCKSLTSINIPDSVTSIGGSAFCGCTSLTEITIPDSVTYIGDDAFENCTNLTEITIPDSVKNIDNRAFELCKNLKEIIILNPECEIWDNYGFTICDTATIYGYENSTAQAYAEKYNRKFVSLGEAPEKENIIGDLNGDGEFNISDALTLQKYLLGVSGTEISDWKQADLNSDGVLDVFDLCLMKKKIVEK